MVSKELQPKDILIYIAIKKVHGLIPFFNKYRETRFSNALEVAKEISLGMDIDLEFLTKHKIKIKRQFDESTDDASIASQSTQESFRVIYFAPVSYQTIASLTSWFEKYQRYKNTFGFLFTSHKLQALDDKILMASCVNLEDSLKSGEQKYVYGHVLFGKLILILELIKELMGPPDILKFL